MDTKKFTEWHIIGTIVITILVSFFIFSAFQESNKPEIDYKNDEYVQELTDKLKEKDEEIKSLKEQYKDIQDSIDALRDDLQPVEGEHFLIIDD